MIAILSALSDEIGKLKTDLRMSGGEHTKYLQFNTGELYEKEVLLGHTGVGIGRARAGTSYVIQKHKPEIIIYAGLGGALSPELRAGDIIIGRNIISLRKGESRALFADIPDTGTAYRKADLLTENRFIHDPVLKRKLFADSGASVVDMETWGVTEASAQSRTPVIAVRSVSTTQRQSRFPISVRFITMREGSILGSQFHTFPQTRDSFYLI